VIAAKSYYERQLPHWHPEGAALFVTWRLHGSLPASVASGLSAHSGKEFARIDRHLDAALSGPTWLKDSRVAAVVVDSLRFAEGELRLFEFGAWVVMSNHVHVVVFPRAPLWRITKAIKGFTAHAANRVLGRTGQPFWQHESFDHWVRDRRELERIVRYVEENPVRAGLVGSAEEWAWSSATAKTGQDGGQDGSLVPGVSTFSPRSVLIPLLQPVNRRPCCASVCIDYY
jgi:REP element-mobilizing transposase RayT